MSYQDNDELVDAGVAFIGQGISDPGTVGVVQLWNPWGSGKVLRLDSLSLAGSGPVVADLRYTKKVIGSEFVDHTANKWMDGPNPVAKVMQSPTDPVGDFPYNRPHHEFWNPSSNDDKQYQFSPAIKIPQGRGIAICTANSAKCIATFQWREYTDPNGPIYEPGPISDMVTVEKAFDGNQTTYATSNGNTSSVSIGYDYITPRAINSIIIKSPVGRSFCGASPIRTISYSVFSSNDAYSWELVTSGVFNDANQDSQATLSILVDITSCRAIKVILSDGVAGWRIGEFSVV